MTGTLALVGGGAWRERCGFDRELLDASGAKEVLVLPTGAAYEQPQHLIDLATRWFAEHEVAVKPLMVLSRPDAHDPANVEAVRTSRFTYLAGGSPLHLRSVLKDSEVWDAISAAWHEGGVLAGSSAGAMVLCDPMVDPRGGAFTIGLGLIEQMAVIPHYDSWSPEKAHRTFQLAAPGLAVVGIDEQTALIREGDGSWRQSGAGKVDVYVDGAKVGLEALPG